MQDKNNASPWKRNQFERVSNDENNKLYTEQLGLTLIIFFLDDGPKFCNACDRLLLIIVRVDVPFSDQFSLKAAFFHGGREVLKKTYRGYFQPQFRGKRGSYPPPASFFFW